MGWSEFTDQPFVSLDKTIQYVYNGIGNIESVNTYAYTPQGTALNTTTTVQSFTYDDSIDDRLTAFGSKAITYNSMGCPTSYDGQTLSWTKGKLTSISSGTLPADTNTYTYTYDAYGRRTQKQQTSISLAGTMPNQTTITTSYDYDHSGRLIRESTVSSYSVGSMSITEKIYLYDESGVIGMIYTADGTSTAYYFRRNLQGDVVAIYDTIGDKVTEYAYDAYGNCTIIDNANSTIASANPFRYRGYYLDSETGWYYLTSRYYSPEWRRFISPDDTAYLNPENANGLNLYCYCNNDPENYADPSGHFPITTILLTAFTCGLIAASTNAIGQVVFDGATLGTMEWERVVIAGASGFLAGLIPGTGFASIAAQAVVSSVVDNGLSAIWLDDEFRISNVVYDTLAFVGSAYLLKGITQITSNMTAKIFVKGGNYSQYQHYYRSKGFNYSRMQVSYLMKSSLLYKEISDEVIKTVLDFYSSFMMNGYVE